MADSVELYVLRAIIIGYVSVRDTILECERCRLSDAKLDGTSMGQESLITARPNRTAPQDDLN